jgi:branched-subunit amino acid ABC-type transport system permease component
MAALVIARCVALGKASSIVAAAVAGFATGLLARLIPDVGRIDIAAHEVTVTALLLAAALLLVAGGLILERAGIDPNRDQRDR